MSKPILNRKNGILILKAVFLIQCLGFVHDNWLYGSSLFKTLWQNVGLTASLATLIDRIFFALFSLVSLAALYFNKKHLYIAAGLFILLISILGLYQGGFWGRYFIITAQAPRYLLPLSLAIFYHHFYLDKEKAYHYLKLTLILAVSLVFATHGIEALLKSPKFVDLILRVSRTYFTLSLTQDFVEDILIIIGIVDILVALFIWLYPSSYLFGYAAFWGFITALSRVMFSPEYGLYSTLIRAANGGIPLALLFMGGFIYILKDKKIVTNGS